MRASRGVKMARNHTLRAQERNSENVQNRAWIDQKKRVFRADFGLYSQPVRDFGIKGEGFSAGFC